MPPNQSILVLQGCINSAAASMSFIVLQLGFGNKSSCVCLQWGSESGGPHGDEQVLACFCVGMWTAYDQQGNYMLLKINTGKSLKNPPSGQILFSVLIHSTLSSKYIC